MREREGGREGGRERETLGRSEPRQRRNIAPEITRDREAVPASGSHAHQQRARAQKCHGGKECRAAGESVEQELLEIPAIKGFGFRGQGSGVRV